MRKFIALIVFVIIVGLTAWVPAKMKRFEDSYQSRLVSALFAIEETVRAAVDSIERVDLHDPVLTHRKVDNLWILSGVAVMQGIVGEPIYANFTSELELLCQSPSDDKCWRVEALTVDDTRFVALGLTLGPIPLHTLAPPAEAQLPTQPENFPSDDIALNVREVSPAPDAADIRNEDAVEPEVQDHSLQDHSLQDHSSETSEVTGQTPPRTLVRQVQEELRKLGYNVGALDGLIGPRTTAAIIAFERRIGLEPRGLPSQQLLDRITQYSARRTELGQQ